MSQEGLTHEPGLDRCYVDRVERDEHNLTFVSLVRLAQAMGCDVATLTTGLPPCGRRHGRDAVYSPSIAAATHMVNSSNACRQRRPRPPRRNGAVRTGIS